VAGALLLESHSWYLTQVLSRSSMKPFSWELQGVVESRKRSSKVNKLLLGESTDKSHKVTKVAQTLICSSTQNTEQGWKREIHRETWLSVQ